MLPITRMRHRAFRAPLNAAEVWPGSLQTRGCRPPYVPYAQFFAPSAAGSVVFTISITSLMLRPQPVGLIMEGTHVYSQAGNGVEESAQAQSMDLGGSRQAHRHCPFDCACADSSTPFPAWRSTCVPSMMRPTG